MEGAVAVGCLMVFDTVETTCHDTGMMTIEEQLEEYGEALRMIHILLSGMDHSDGERTYGAEVLGMVSAAITHKNTLLVEAAEMLEEVRTGEDFEAECHNVADKINTHLFDEAGNNQHIHKASGLDHDLCAICGHDLRHPIHIRR